MPEMKSLFKKIDIRIWLWNKNDCVDLIEP